MATNTEKAIAIKAAANSITYHSGVWTEIREDMREVKPLVSKRVYDMLQRMSLIEVRIQRILRGLDSGSVEDVRSLKLTLIYRRGDVREELARLGHPEMADELLA
jgi:hypothetical protein